MCDSQMLPEKPNAQAQTYWSIGTVLVSLDSLQVAPFMQGDEAHSLMSKSQLPWPVHLLHVFWQNVPMVLPWS